MPRQSKARENLIGTAVQLFRTKGYNGVGLTELLAVSGAPKGSFYHHFPGGKEELGVAALSLSDRVIGDLIEACFAASSNEREAVERLAETIAALFEKSSYRAGCPITSIAIDAMPQSASLTTAGQAVLTNWNEIAVKHAMRWGRTQGEAQAFADRLTIALEGAWLVARIRQSKAPFSNVVSMTCD